MYVAFGLRERGDHFFMNGRTMTFSYREPIEADFYVLDTDYPEVFIPGHGSVTEEYTSKWNNYPAFHFDPDKYVAGERAFLPFDPISDPYFHSAHRRYKINDAIVDIIPIETELKNARKVINILCQILVDNNLLVELPNELTDWNDAIGDAISDYTKSLDNGLMLEGRRDINGSPLITIPDGADTDLWVRHFHRTSHARLSESRCAQAAHGVGPLKNWDKTKARADRRTTSAEEQT